MKGFYSIHGIGTMSHVLLVVFVEKCGRVMTPPQAAVSNVEWCSIKSVDNISPAANTRSSNLPPSRRNLWFYRGLSLAGVT